RCERRTRSGRGCDRPGRTVLGRSYPIAATRSEARQQGDRCRPTPGSRDLLDHTSSSTDHVALLCPLGLEVTATESPGGGDEGTKGSRAWPTPAERGQRVAPPRTETGSGGCGASAVRGYAAARAIPRIVAPTPS